MNWGKEKKGTLQFLISIRIERKYKGTRNCSFKKKTTFHSQTLKTLKRSRYQRQPQGKDHLKDETEIFLLIVQKDLEACLMDSLN